MLLVFAGCFSGTSPQEKARRQLCRNLALEKPSCVMSGLNLCLFSVKPGNGVGRRAWEGEIAWKPVGGLAG